MFLILFLWDVGSSHAQMVLIFLFSNSFAAQVANLSRHAHVRQLELDTAFWAAWTKPGNAFL